MVGIIYGQYVFVVNVITFGIHEILTIRLTINYPGRGKALA